MAIRPYKAATQPTRERRADGDAKQTTSRQDFAPAVPPQLDNRRIGDGTDRRIAGPSVRRRDGGHADRPDRMRRARHRRRSPGAQRLPARQAHRHGRRLRRPARRKPSRRLEGASGPRGRAGRAPLRRHGCLRARDGYGCGPGDPGDAAGLSTAAVRRGGDCRQTRVHGKTRRGGRARHSQGGRRQRAGEGQRPGGSGWSEHPPPEQRTRSDRPRPQRRHRADHVSARLRQQRRRVGPSAAKRRKRDAIPDAQLVLLQLALRRPDRRADRPCPRPGRLGQGRPPHRRSGHGRTASAHRARLR